MKRFLSLGFLSTVLIVAGGCSLLSGSTSRTQSGTSGENIKLARDASLHRIVEGEKSSGYGIKIGGWGNKLDVKFPPPPDRPFRDKLDYDEQSAESAGAWTTWLNKYKFAIPLGVSIILVGIGILVFLFAIKKVRQSSAAANAALTVADNAIGQQIMNLGTKLASSTSPHINAELSAQMAQLEKARGKINSEKPK